MSTSVSAMQQLLGPWMTGANPGALDNSFQQYGGTQGLLAALMQGAGPDTTQAREGAALQKAQALALDEAKARQGLAQGSLNLQQQMQLARLKQAYYRAALGGNPAGSAPASDAGVSPAPMPNTATTPGAPQSAPLVPPRFSLVNPQSTVSSPAPATAPSWLTPPTPQQISATPVGGMSPAMIRLGALLGGKDPLAAAASLRQQQQAIVQRQYGQQIAQLDTLTKSDTPSRYVAASPQLTAAWQQIAPQLGFDPTKDFTDANVRTAFSFARNRLAGALGETATAPPTALSTITLPDGRKAQVDPVTGKMAILPPSPMEKVVVNGKPELVPTAKAEGMTPYNQFSLSTQQLQGPEGALLAALTSNGVKLPAGRGGQQLVATLHALIANNPNTPIPQIAEMVRTGQLDFNGAKRSTGQLATLSAAADVQSRKIVKDLDSLGPIVQKLPNGPAKLAQAMTHLEKDWSWNGDATTTEAVGYIKELAGEYAKLVSGSTGMAAPAEGEMKSALGLMQTALTKGGYQGMHDFLVQTSLNRRSAVKEGLHAASEVGAGVGSGAGENDHPPDISALLKKYQ